MVLKAVYMMMDQLFEQVYPEEVRQGIESLVEVTLPLINDSNLDDYQDQLEDIDFIFSGWGSPAYTKHLLDKMPNLKVIFYSGGTMKHLLDDDFWRHQVRVTTANQVNAKPVSEFTLGEILLSLKNVWSMNRMVKKERTFQNGVFLPVTGIYQSKVGLVSMSSIGRDVAEKLQDFDVDILSYDPYVQESQVEHLGVKMVSLEDLFKESDVISLHTPLLEETRGMITKELFQSMKRGATFINTARGAIIDEAGLIDVLQARPDLTALLDVTDPEPPLRESALYDLENVILTPHIAGSVGQEKARLGQAMLDELRNYLDQAHLDYEITEESYKTMA